MLIPSSTNRRVDSFALFASYAHSCLICPPDFFIACRQEKILTPQKCDVEAKLFGRLLRRTTESFSFLEN